MVLKKLVYCQKSSKFCTFWTIYDLVRISPTCGPNTYQIMYGEILNFHCQQERVVRANLLQKMIFPMGFLCYLNWCWYWKSKISLHALFDKNMIHMLVQFKQNCMVRYIQNFKLFWKNKRLTIFEKVLTSFWNTFL